MSGLFLDHLQSHKQLSALKIHLIRVTWLKGQWRMVEGLPATLLPALQRASESVSSSAFTLTKGEVCAVGGGHGACWGHY